MIDISRCKAKDPKTCPYHGIAIRVNEAEQKGDFNAYYTARKELDRARAKLKITNLLKPVDQREDLSEEIPPYRDVLKEIKQKVDVADSELKPVPQRLKPPVPKEGKLPSRSEVRSELGRQARTRYLEQSAAVPTPMEAYALWLALYRAQGGIVQENPVGEYSRTALINEFDTAFRGAGEPLDPQNVDYNSLAWNRYTPTRNGGKMPPLYGSSSLELLLLQDVVQQDLAKGQDLEDGSVDTRKGWEWGHSRVYILKRDPRSPYGFRAETNSPHPVKTYTDVERFLKGKSLPNIINLLGAKEFLNPELPQK